MKDRILGCLLGGACGDALGAPTEFLSMRQIAALYGPDGIRNFDQAYGLVGGITDDTQMTLFVTDGIIRAHSDDQEPSVAAVTASVHLALLRWLETQEPGSYRRVMDQDPDGWLIEEQRLHARRAPGTTCLTSLRQKRALGAPAENNSKGCGGVMRSAPFGFLARTRDDIPLIMKLASASAHTTHGHPSGYYSAAALAGIVAHLLHGAPLAQAAQDVVAVLNEQPEAGEVVEVLKLALDLSEAPGWKSYLPQLGEGWVGEEALAIALLCALAAETAEEAIIAAANHNGDTDSTAAIAGNIVGTIYGVEALPKRWLDLLELKDVVERLSTDFAQVMDREAGKAAALDKIASTDRPPETDYEIEQNKQKGGESGRPYQNRVTPFGAFEAVPEKGMLMGNRGTLHNAAGKLGASRWQGKRWITCHLSFKDRPAQKINKEGHYTQLFFCDEATSFAAGHRPCAECRRDDWRRFLVHWEMAHNLPADRHVKADDVDKALHESRVGRNRVQRRFSARLGSLPEGAFVVLGDPSNETAWLVWEGQIHRWSHGGYVERRTVSPDEVVEVLTPKSVVEVFAAGYRPVVHHSAHST